MGIVGEIDQPDYAEAELAGKRVEVAQAALLRARLRGPAAHLTAVNALRTAHLELYRAQPAVFRVTGGTMAVAHEVMGAYSMLDEIVRPEPFPTLAAFGVTPTMMAEACEGGGETLELVRYRATYDAVLDKQAAANPLGIPLYKLASPNGWLVTPDEVSAALGAYRTALTELPLVELWWWPAWVEFLELAAKNHGFRVS